MVLNFFSNKIILFHVWNIISDRDGDKRLGFRAIKIAQIFMETAKSYFSFYSLEGEWDPS